MKKKDESQPVGGAEEGRRPTGAPPTGRAGERGRFSSQRKMEAVLRLLRGEELDVISRELGVSGATLAGWKEAFLSAGSVPILRRYRSGCRRAQGLGKCIGRVIEPRNNPRGNRHCYKCGRPHPRAATGLAGGFRRGRRAGHVGRGPPRNLGGPVVSAIRAVVGEAMTQRTLARRRGPTPPGANNRHGALPTTLSTASKR